jgi:N,N'-diacetyllegionaminate synthase
MSVYIIAEIGQAHDGSLGILHSYIDALSESGVSALKFQTHIAEAESSAREPFRVKFSYEDKTRYDYWKRMEFSLEQWVEIKQHCESVGVEFLSSPFSLLAVDWLESVGVTKYKIGSGEVNNLLMLEKIARTGKEIILSSGLSNYLELDMVMEYLKPFKNKVSILQCTTKYPTEAKDIGLNVIAELKRRYGVPTGLSDHSGYIYPSLAAAALGAEIIEFHVVFDRRMFGPDSKSSLIIDEVKQLVEGVRFIEKSLVHSDKVHDDEKNALKNIFEKSLAINRDIYEGEIISFDDLEAKKPSGYGVTAREFRKIIGKKVNKNLKKWSFIREEDLNG